MTNCCRRAAAVGVFLKVLLPKQSWSPMIVTHLDHFVLTVADIEATCRFYEEVLGVERVSFGDDRSGLMAGALRINLHQAGRELSPHAAIPVAGSADLCFICSLTMDELVAHLERRRVGIELGPVERIGVQGTMMSVYIRDPDKNLIELSVYPS
jgi:catechol 2,3-dioxygenase-like lactoylglutathione lyase family enzyme